LYNLEEIKVRWKKAALENCSGVPCVVAPPAPSFACGTSTVLDFDGNAYNTVSIGSQCWTVTNLKVTKYNDGTVIPDETANTAGWGILATGARAEYVGAGIPSSGYVGTYGYLYNWYAATDLRKICPTGWHVPTDSDWNKLVKSIDSGADTSGTSLQSIIAGGKMKSIGTAYWDSPNTLADNSSGFNALPGGFRNSGGSFIIIRSFAFFWSTDESGGNPLFRMLGTYDSNVARNINIKSAGVSVRCLRD